MAFEAKFGGVCGKCEERYSIGTLIRFSHEDVLVHDTCPDPDVVGMTARPVCPRCFIEVSNIGTCGCDD